MIVEPGAVVGPVRLAKLLRKASTHQLYEGRHLRLGVDVALRLVPSASSDDSLLQDARRAADARHAALAPVLDFGEYGDLRYVVTARVYGKTLAEHLGEHAAALPEHAVARVLRRVAEALQVLHGVGLAHGNIRPSSLVMDARGQLRLTDLSFAAERRPAAALHASTDERSLYLPPEAASPLATDATGPSADMRLDLFALGVIAYESIFRCMPYRPGASSSADVEPPRFDAPNDCSRALLASVERLIARDPDTRIASAAALLEILPPDPEAAPRAAASDTKKPTPGTAAPDSEFASVLRFLQRRFGSRKTHHAEGAVVHSSLRERTVVWMLLLGLLCATAAALLTGSG